MVHNKEDSFLLYSKFTKITGQKLGEYLGIDSGDRIPTSKSFIICWGAGRDDVSNNGIEFLNHPESIRRNSNKLNSLKIMGDNGVNVPTFCTSAEIINYINSGKMEFPVIGRRLRHQGGSYFYICRSISRVEKAIKRGADYFIQHIPNEREFRLQIFQNRVIKSQEKYPREDEHHYMIRSDKKGWGLKKILVRGTNLPKHVKDECKKAVSALDLNFGAVDVLLGDDDKPYVIEINTGPSLNDTNVELYGDNFKGFLE